MKTKWYCRFAEEQEGPFSSRQMRALAKEGRITSKTAVRREADECWYAASKVKGLLKKKKPKRSASEVSAVQPPVEAPASAAPKTGCGIAPCCLTTPCRST